jgi:4-aminobutyrate aminotransferase-like enzyme/Ser/Thr protein kinase RdoA (MazF antagonist)
VLIEARESFKFTTADAERIAHDVFGIQASARELVGEFDVNFALTASSAKYVLKIMRTACDPKFVDLQVVALGRLLNLPVPRVAGRAKNVDGRIVWLLEWVEGRLLADLQYRSPRLLEHVGEVLGRVDRALESFTHPASVRELKWDLKRAGWIAEYLQYISNDDDRRLVERVLRRSEEIAPLLGNLRHSVIHGDANDHNLLVERDQVTGLLDFGDLHYTATICDLAIACAYAGFGTRDPLSAMVRIVRGYHREYPLQEREIELLFPLILTRLAVSVVNSAYLATQKAGWYVSVSEKNAWASLRELSTIPERLAIYRFRDACSLAPVPRASRIAEYLRSAPAQPVVRGRPSAVFDLSFGSLLLGSDPGNCETGRLTETLFARMPEGTIGIGRYDEARPIYSAPSFSRGEHPTDERRTIHIGLDLFAKPGTPVCAPFAGSVHAFANNKARLDYGPVIVLRHATSDGAAFYTLYGHLSLDSLDELILDRPIAAGEEIGRIGAPPDNGDWPPHLHFQLITDLLDLNTDFPGVAYASQRDVWLSLSPDPNLVTRFSIPPREPEKTETLASRRAHLGSNLSISYREPLKIVRGWRQYLYDETGRVFLDVYNNVPLVGHGHPRVAEAVARQIALLNTNTRYLHDNITRYAERLIAKFPDPLRVCYFLNSASEANELALRLARAHIGRDDTIVLEHAYHGNTNTLIDISPYKFAGRGGRGKRPWVHVAPMPDPHRRDDPAAGLEYGLSVAEIAKSPMTFIAESLPSVGGQVVFPPKYLDACYTAVRAAGGVCIADEVQVGFGRLGDFFWGFEMQDVMPDIVVLGKPMGNGFPVAGVVTTPEIAASFDNGMEFFSTYGGNPVACAAGLAVLDVLEDERLPENAARVGEYLIRELRKLDVPDVRGRGLFLGVELAEEGSWVVNRLRERGILAGTEGPRNNVIKIRPPLIFSEDDAEFFVNVLRETIADACVHPI